MNLKTDKKKSPLKGVYIFYSVIIALCILALFVFNLNIYAKAVLCTLAFLCVCIMRSLKNAMILPPDIDPDTMQLIEPDVATICTGMAASMGSVLLCAGEKGKRSCLPHSRVLIHQPLGGANGQASDILIAAKEIEKTRKELYDIISSHTGQPYDKVFADADRDYWMTSQEALEYGMVDEILTKKTR